MFEHPDEFRDRVAFRRLTTALVAMLTTSPRKMAWWGAKTARRFQCYLIWGRVPRHRSEGARHPKVSLAPLKRAACRPDVQTPPVSASGSNIIVTVPGCIPEPSASRNYSSFMLAGVRDVRKRSATAKGKQTLCFCRAAPSLNFRFCKTCTPIPVRSSAGGARLKLHELLLRFRFGVDRLRYQREAGDRQALADNPKSKRHLGCSNWIGERGREKIGVVSTYCDWIESRRYIDCIYIIL